LQLISSTNDETLYTALQAEVRELRNLIEKYELWRGMATPEEAANGLRCADILVHLRAVVLEPDPLWLGGGLQFRAQEHVQVMLRNLGAFEVAMLIRKAIPLGSARKGVAADIARGIYILNNDFLCWFMHRNPHNQVMAFPSLSEFAAEITHNVGSTAVIMEMVRDNNATIQMVPQQLFDTVTRWMELQLEVEADPAGVELLRLLVLCAGIVIGPNQLRVFRLLMTPGIVPKLHTCKEVGSAEYQERIRWMRTCGGSAQDSAAHLSLADEFSRARAGTRAVPLRGTEVDNAAGLAVLSGASSARIGVNTTYFYMPRQLQFHVQVLKLMATCAGGKINIVEAKIQTMFPLQTLLNTIMEPFDDGSLLLDVRMPLTSLLYDTFVNVEVADPLVSANPRFWELLETFPVAILVAEELLRSETKGQRESQQDSGREVRSAVRYVLDEIMPFLHYYLEVHYNMRNILHSEIRTLSQVQAFLAAAHTATQRLYALQSTCMSATQSNSMLAALKLLARHTQQPDPVPIVAPSKAAIASGGVGNDGLADSFSSAVLAFAGHEAAVELTQLGMRDCASRIKALPKLADPVRDAIRYEPLLKKMIRHARGLITVETDRKALNHECQASLLWMLKLFRTMIEDEWGFSYEERDAMGDEASDEVAWPVQRALTECGLVELCIDLVSYGIDRFVITAALRLLVTLLFREGGSPFVQQTMNKHFHDSPTSTMFFAKINDILAEVLLWSDICEKTSNPQVPDTVKVTGDSTGGHGFASVGDDDDPETPNMIVMKLLQLMCEGHYGPNQSIMKEQSFNEESFNLLDQMVEIVAVYTPVKNRSSTAVISFTSELILEVLQGPCVMNQEHFALETELMEGLNTLLRTEQREGSDQVAAEERKCKVTILKIFKAITECQKKPSLVFERLMSAVHAEALTRHLRVAPPPVPLDTIKDEIERAEAVDAQQKREEAPLDEMQVECLVLIQMMCDYMPEFPQEVNLPASLLAKMGTEVVSVEIVWNDQLQRRFFHVPIMCNQLASATRNELVQQVDRVNQDMKQQDFIRRSKVILCELEHQEQLRALGIDKAFNRNNQNLMTWISFVVNVCINFVSLQYLAMPDGDYDEETKTYAMGKGVLSSTNAELCQAILNYTQITCSAFTLVLYVIVRSPVMYKNALANKNTTKWSAIVAVIHPFRGLTPYYFMYVVFAVLGMYYPMCNALLLFDILIKNSTSRDVLLAVTKPVKQIAATALLLVIVIYVCAFCYFIQYRDHFQFGECDTLGNCFILCVTYGMRYGGGVGDYLTDKVHNIKTVERAASEVFDDGSRFWLDMMYFIVSIIVLMNIIFGIIIDNFAELRDLKKSRLIDTTEFCFICGISRRRFDKEGPRAFHKHLTEEHGMWNYLKFMVHLWNQDQDDDDGLEQYVRAQIARGDVDWFPGNECMSLAGEDGEGELDLEGFQKDIVSTLKKKQDENNDKMLRQMRDMLDIYFKDGTGPTSGKRASLAKPGDDLPALAALPATFV
jgi:hypothetical protein